ncbi:MAG: DinB family protein [Steroidobacteraceae bacterium]
MKRQQRMESTMTQPYSQLIAMKRWADRGLYEAVSRNFERLTREESAIMLRILDHIHTVDRIFQHHLRGLPHGFRAPRSETMPDLQTLASGTHEVDDWYASYVDGLAEGGFEQPVEFVFTSGKPARMRRGEIILHVCMHWNYHRGNAGAVLQLKGITPSRDSITDFLEDVS